MGEFKSTSMHYNGEWADDNVHGKGKLTVGKNTVYSGKFVEAVFIEGEHLSAEGTLYKGSFVSFDKLDGKGKRPKQKQNVLFISFVVERKCTLRGRLCVHWQLESGPQRRRR